MSEDLTEKEKVRFEFTSQGIFERRKTQYVFFLFYLGAAGACASLVLGAKSPEERLLVLLVPILLQLPVYFTWWYQRNQIYNIDDIRKSIIGLENDVNESWQTPHGKYSNDIMMLLVPAALVSLAWLVLRHRNPDIFSADDFVLLCQGAFLSTILSSSVGIYFHKNRLNYEIQRSDKLTQIAEQLHSPDGEKTGGADAAS